MLADTLNKLIHRSIVIYRRSVASINKVTDLISLRRLGIKAAVVKKIRKNIIVTKRTHILALAVYNRYGYISVETHFLKSLTDGAIHRNVLDKALGNNKAHYIHFSPHCIPIIAAPMAVENLARSGITK